MKEFDKLVESVLTEANQWGRYGSDMSADGWSLFPMQRPTPGTKVEIVKYIDGNKEKNTEPLEGRATDTDSGVALYVKEKPNVSRYKQYDSNYKLWWKRIK